MPTKVLDFHYRRTFELKVDPARALELRERGLTLPQIKAALGTDANLSTIDRAILTAQYPGMGCRAAIIARRATRPVLDVETARALQREGMSYRQIKATLGWPGSIATIWRSLRA